MWKRAVYLTESPAGPHTEADLPKLVHRYVKKKNKEWLWQVTEIWNDFLILIAD